MSGENAEMVRQRLVVGARPRRRFEERLALQFPGVFGLLARGISRLRPSRRLRQLVLRRAVQLSLEATNRGDLKIPFAFHDPDCELIVPAQLAELGQRSVRGYEERIRFQRRWAAEWGEFRFLPEEMIDLGERVLVIGRVKGSGLRSGAAFDNEWALLINIRDGRVIREQTFFDRREALEAVGLPA